MESLVITEYKHGSKNNVYSLNFVSKSEILAQIRSWKEFSETAENEESEACENLYKFSIRFNFEGLNYSFKIDA